MNVLGVTVFSGTACFVVEAAPGDDPWPIRIQTFFFATMGLTNSRFRRDVLFVLARHANVRKQNLDSRNESETRTIRQCQETESRFTERIGNTNNIYVSDQGKLFLRDRACCY